MYDHSVKVPRLYKVASNIAKKVSDGQGSLKQLIYERKHPNIKALYALVAETLQRGPNIDILLKKSKLPEKEPRFDMWLARVLMTELLWGKKRLAGESKPIKTILAYEQILKAHMSDADAEAREAPQVEKPRYVRVNTLRLSPEEAISGFEEENFFFCNFRPKITYEDFLNQMSMLKADEFMRDLHIPNLLIFPPKTQFYNHEAYKKGSIILQDKASCLPVHLLDPQPGSSVLDMCAAPGMKTTQIAAMIDNKGSIYAVEMDQNRFKTMNTIVEASGATCIKPINADVLTLRDGDCPDVEYILVDPSCSGSGIVDRLSLDTSPKDPARLQKLAGFQIMILRHALTRFPKAKRIVYSTCSLYSEENEDVVRQVMETCTNFKLINAGERIKGAWLNYGSPDFGELGKYCLYAKPEDDLTNGFFVAVLERLEEGERNQFLNAGLIKLQKDEYRRRNFEESQNQEENYEQGYEKEQFGEEHSTFKNESVTNQSKKKNKRKESKQENKDEGMVSSKGCSEDNEKNENYINEVNTNACKKKKRKEKKRKREEDSEMKSVNDSNSNKEKRVAQKVKPSSSQVSNEEDENLENIIIEKRSKKKKKHTDKNEDSSVNNALNENYFNASVKVSKNKKNLESKLEHSVEESSKMVNQASDEIETEVPKKKRKRKTIDVEVTAHGSEECEAANEASVAKRKRKEKTMEVEVTGDGCEEIIVVKKHKKSKKQC